MNFLKPKNTALNQLGVVYKRFIGLEKMTSLDTCFATILQNNATKYWIFNKDSENFVEISNTMRFRKIIYVESNQAFVYKDKKYIFKDDNWVIAGEGDYKLLSVEYAPTSEYQTNKYYYVGTLSFMIKGGIEGTTSQHIKGSVLPLDSLNITYYNDDIKVDRDDIVVFNGRMFVVEDTEVVQKRMPKPFNIYSSTLINKM